jgi:hypothetical protein
MNESMHGVLREEHHSIFKGLNDHLEMNQRLRAQEKQDVIVRSRERNRRLHGFPRSNGKKSNDGGKIDIRSKKMNRPSVQETESKGSSCPRSQCERIIEKSPRSEQRGKKLDQHQESNKRVPRRVSKGEEKARGGEIEAGDSLLKRRRPLFRTPFFCSPTIYISFDAA